MGKKKEKKFQEEIADSAHKIWLAGLGALSAAEEEGSKLFKRLVERGEEFESRGKSRVEEVRDKVKHKVSSAWEDVEDTLDDQVTAALHRLGVPTRDEIRKLTQRVEELSGKVDKLKPKAKAKAKAKAAS